MEHSFNIEIAKEFGVNCAIIYKNLEFWCMKNKANDKNFIDGNFWTYNSIEAWKKLFPYLGESQIKTALKKLEEAGLIEVGNHNKSSYDRTKWFCIIHLAVLANGSDDNSQPIPDNKPNINQIKEEEEEEEEEEGFGSQKDFINFCRINLIGKEFEVANRKYYFNNIGELKSTESEKPLKGGMAMAIFKMMYQKQLHFIRYAKIHSKKE